MGSHNEEEHVASIRLLEAQSHIWKHTTSILHSMSLKSAIELGIPDIIHSYGKPITLHQLVSSLSIHPSKTSKINRLMRLLTHSGFFSLQKLHDDPQLEGYVLTEASTLLLKDHLFSVSPLVLSMLDPIITKPMHEMVNWLQKDDDPTPFDATYKRGFWDYAWHEPKLYNWFNDLLVNDSRLVASVVVDTCKGVFEGLESLVDVGGHTGTMVKEIAKAFPKMKCIVFDSPYVVGGLKGSGNLKFIAGDMFDDAIPPSDGILFKWTLHDWDDEACVKVLKKCKEAITSKGKGGKVVIIDMVIENKDEKEDSNKLVEAQLLFDIMMMTYVTGKERNEKEWANLFFSAGFSNYKITPSIVGLRSLIEVFP